MNTGVSDDESLFAQALERAPAERHAFLAAACAGDPARLDRISHLLRAHADAAPDFLHDSPVAERFEPGMSQRIGRYKLLQQIGEGGCGTVFMAEQEEPVRRRVALKLIKLGMDTREVIARFEAERQALALMDHPNIARVLDAGATDAGRPFFVMELVRGVPVTRFCDEQKLPTRARIELFTQVCSAVQHAHQKGIIHRDLKPSNILVTLHDGVPVPKVIDFGIAKATQGRLTDHTLFTAFEQFLGTPAYMSPEQAELSGLDVDTRSDVYSLGVLLYELLTGRPPFDPTTLARAGLDEIRRIIREVDPPRPSTRLSTLSDADRTTLAHARGTAPTQLSVLLRGDLDWIVMRCLEKDRTRRYETSGALAADLKRHLHDEPISTRPPSTAYTFQKLVRRHRTAFVLSAGIASSLVAGLVATSVLYWREHTARRRAETAEDERAAALVTALEQKALAETNARRAQTEAATSRAVMEFLERDLLGSAAPNREPDRDLRLRTVLDRAAARIDGRFGDQPLVEAAIRSTIASTYYSLGEYAATERHLDRLIELRREILGAEHPDTLSVIGRLMMSLRMLGRSAEAEKLGLDWIALLQRTRAPDDPAILSLRSRLGPIYLSQGRGGDLLALRLGVLAASRRELGPEHPFTLSALSDLAYAYHRGAGNLPAAARTYEETIALMERVLGPEHPETIDAIVHVAPVYHDQGRLEECAAMHQRALETRRRTLGHEHPDTLTSMSNLAYVYRSAGKLSEAIELQSSALEMKQRVLGPNHHNTLQSVGWLADAYVTQGNFAEAVRLNQRVIAARTATVGAGHPETLTAIARLAGIYRTQKRFSEAADLLAQVLDGRQRILGPHHPHTQQTIGLLARALLQDSQFERAEALLRPSLVSDTDRTARDWQFWGRQSQLGEALLGLKRASEAEPLLLEAFAELTARESLIPPGQYGVRRDTARRLAQLYTTKTDADQAARWRKTADELNRRTPSPSATTEP